MLTKQSVVTRLNLISCNKVKRIFLAFKNRPYNVTNNSWISDYNVKFIPVVNTYEYKLLKSLVKQNRLTLQVVYYTDGKYGVLSIS